MNGTTVTFLGSLFGSPLSSGAFGTAAALTGKANTGFAVQDGNTVGDGSTRFGLRGQEDLGGGMAAVFQLEAGVNLDDGSLGNGGGQLFSRTAMVGLTGGFGEFTLGRQVNPAFKVQSSGSAMGVMNGLADAGSMVTGSAFAGGVRSSNSVRYATPNLGGFTGELLLAAPEDPAPTFNSNRTIVTTPEGKLGASLGLNYNSGPLYLGVGYDSRKAVATTSVVSTGVQQSSSNGERKTWVLSAAYDLGSFKPYLSYTRDRSTVDSSSVALISGGITEKVWVLGVTAPMGAGLVFAEYGNSKTQANASLNGIPGTGDAAGKERAFSLGYRYNLSKRTWMQAAYGTYKQDAWVQDSTHYDLDTTRQHALALTLSHSF